MTCTTAVFSLMCGAAALMLAAMYFYAQNTRQKLTAKAAQLNAALSALQQERAELIIKTENMFSENASQSVHVTHLAEENRVLRGTLDRVETDNRELTNAYQTLDNKHQILKNDNENLAGEYRALKKLISKHTH